MAPILGHVLRVLLNANFTDLPDTGGTIGPEENAERPGHEVVELAALTRIREIPAVSTGRALMLHAA